MHDLGVSPTHTVLIDMPLSLDPLNLLRGKSVVYYSPSTLARFGIFPRHFPGDVRWFETPACVIFHTALTYDSKDAVNLLCCRLNSSTLVYAAGNLEMPKDQLLPPGQKDTCELYYFRFPLDPPPLAVPTHGKQFFFHRRTLLIRFRQPSPSPSFHSNSPALLLDFP